MKLTPAVEEILRAVLARGSDAPTEEVEVSAGREHAERRAAQAAAARKRPVKRRQDIDWKKEEQ